MDIINRQKQKELLEAAAQRRHQERVRAGEEVLHPKRPHRAHQTDTQTRAKPPTQRTVTQIVQRPHYVRRLFLTFMTTIFVFGLGSALYVGIKAYLATAQMTLPTPATHAETQVTTAKVETHVSPTNQHIQKHTETIAVRQPSPEHSFVRNSLSAAGTLIGKRTPLRGEDDGQINILLLGKGTEDHPGKDLTDTIMLARIDVEKGKIALFSLPRDLYVRIPNTKSATKINALYNYGLQNNAGAEYITDAVAQITRLPIHYFLVADFDAFISIVDALDGINITVDRKINDTRYPGPNYSYETFTLDPGLTHLDGATALKYVRTRHGDPEGDFGRAKRQQQVLQAIKNKAFSLGTLSNPLTIGKLFDVIGAHVRTNMSIADITSLVALFPQLDTQNITTVVVDAWKSESLLRVIHVGKMFALVPRAGRFDYVEIRDVAQTIFQRLARARLRSEVAREKPTVTLVRSGASLKTAQYVRTLLIDSINLTTKNIPITRAQKQEYTHHAQIIDHTDTTKPFTLTALLTLLGATLINDSTDTFANSSADIHVLLGTDADDFFRESTISKEQFDKADATQAERVMILTED